MAHHLAPGLNACAETPMGPCKLGSPKICGQCARGPLGDFCLRPQACPSAAAVNGGFATLPGMVGLATMAPHHRAGLAQGGGGMAGPVPGAHTPTPYPRGYNGFNRTCGCDRSNFSVCHLPSANPALVAMNPSTPCSLKIYGDLY